MAVFPVYFILGLGAVFFATIHQPIQLYGRVADLSQARLGLCLGTLFHWLALFSVAFGLMWMQPTQMRTHLVTLAMYIGAQALLLMAVKGLTQEGTVPLNPKVQAGKLGIFTAVCGAFLIVPGVCFVLELFGVGGHLKL